MDDVFLDVLARGVMATRRKRHASNADRSGAHEPPRRQGHQGRHHGSLPVTAGQLPVGELLGALGVLVVIVGRGISPSGSFLMKLRGMSMAVHILA